MSARIYNSHYWSDSPTTYPRCHEAVLKGDASALTPILNGEQPINNRDVDGNTVLALAAFCDQREMVKTLLAKGAHVNAKDKKQQTPLHKASRQGHAEVTALLLEHKADVDRKKTRDETPLMLACARGHLSVARILIDAGADVNARDMYSRVPLTWAIKGGNQDIVKLLHKQGASFGCTDRFRKNAIIQAAKCNHAEILAFILETDLKGLKNEDSLFRGPMQVAAWKNSSQSLETLIRHGVNINDKSSRGRTALMEAAFAGHLECIEVLLQNPGCDVNLTDEYGSTALTLCIAGRVAAEAVRRNRMWCDVVFNLVNANSDLRIQTRSTMFWDQAAINKHHQNALELALKAGHADTVKLLARAGSDLGNLVLYFKLPTKALPLQIRKNQRLFDWLRRFHRSPRPLVEQCRNAFRQHYGSRWLQIRDSLEVAPAVRRYLNFGDMDEFVAENRAKTESWSARESKGRQEQSIDDSRSELDYEPSAFESDWYGKLDDIIDTESEEEDERPANSGHYHSFLPGGSWAFPNM